MSEEALRYAVVRAKNFALQALCRNDPGLAGRAVALVSGEGRKTAVKEASPEAFGIAPGLPAALAAARCPGILFRPRDPAAEAEAQGLLIAACFTLSPRVEATAYGVCTIDLQGDDSARTRLRSEALAAELLLAGLAVSVGIGRTPLLAAYAAEWEKGGAGLQAVRVPDDEKSFLRDLPLCAADPSPAQAEIAARWGLRTCGELTALPKSEVGRRLGVEGVALWERAAGETTRVLRLVEPAKTFAAQWAYEPPVESMEPLLFRLRRFAERLALELRGAGFVAERLALTLLLEDESDYRREFRLPEPGADIEGWMRIFYAHLESVRTPSRVAGARIVAFPCRPPQKQDGLFDMGLVDPASFWENLARLAAIVGSDRVGTPLMANSRRPDAFTLEKPPETVPPPSAPLLHPMRGLALRRFRPSRPAQVEFSDAQPCRLEARDVRGAVAACRGPWRESGEWWRRERWGRETWQIELAAGGLYQIARTAGGWIVEGMLD